MKNKENKTSEQKLLVARNWAEIELVILVILGTGMVTDYGIGL